MYRDRLWTMRQYSGFGTAEQTNERFKFLLERGQTGLSVAVESLNKMGYDSDHPRDESEVGGTGVAADRIRGTVQNGILKEYSARGTYISPPRQSMRLVTDLFAYCQKRIPRWNVISISGYHMREAGC